MPKTFAVKMSPEPVAKVHVYVVTTCPKCGKKTYGVAGQKGKKCPVCRHQYAMPGGGDIPTFRTPEEACRFIQVEEAKRAGRMDFAPAAGGFRPASVAPTIPRTTKLVAEAKSLGAQFATWARQYFALASGDARPGLPTTVVIAAAAKAGFAGVEVLLENAVKGGILYRPKPYLVGLSPARSG